MLGQLADDDRAVDAGILGDETRWDPQGSTDDLDADPLVVVLGSELFECLACVEQSDAAARHDALLDRGAGRVHGVLDAVLALLHLELGRPAHANDGDPAGELGEALLQLLAVASPSTSSAMMRSGRPHCTTDSSKGSSIWIAAMVSFNQATGRRTFFVHISAVQRAGRSSLAEGRKISFRWSPTAASRQQTTRRSTDGAERWSGDTGDGYIAINGRDAPFLQIRNSSAASGDFMCCCPYSGWQDQRIEPIRRSTSCREASGLGQHDCAEAKPPRTVGLEAAVDRPRAGQSPPGLAGLQ
jgi:cold shock CspA family protein